MDTIAGAILALATAILIQASEPDPTATIIASALFGSIAMRYLIVGHSQGRKAGRAD